MINEAYRNVQSTRRGHSKLWRSDLKFLVTQLILSTEWSKGRMLRHVKQKLKATWTTFADDIEKIKSKDLWDCVKSLIVQFLKMLDSNPPKATSWYPNKALAMAYRICRCSDLDSGFLPLCNQLRSRLQKTSIPIPGAGIIFHVSFSVIVCMSNLHAHKIKPCLFTFTHHST